MLGNGDILNMVESTMEHYPTSLVVLSEMQHLKAAPCPDFLRQLISVVLTMAHMTGSDPFNFSSIDAIKTPSLIVYLEIV